MNESPGRVWVIDSPLVNTHRSLNSDGNEKTWGIRNGAMFKLSCFVIDHPIVKCRNMLSKLNVLHWHK